MDCCEPTIIDAMIMQKYKVVHYFDMKMEGLSGRKSTEITRGIRSVELSGGNFLNQLLLPQPTKLIK